MEECCENCKYWVKNLLSFDNHEEYEDHLKYCGDCRRNAPKVNHDGKTIFPSTRENLWCGEYKPIKLEEKYSEDTEKMCASCQYAGSVHCSGSECINREYVDWEPFVKSCSISANLLDWKRKE